MEDGGWMMEDGRWKMEDGGWRMEDGGWRMVDGGCKNLKFETSEYDSDHIILYPGSGR